MMVELFMKPKARLERGFLVLAILSGLGSVSRAQLNSNLNADLEYSLFSQRDPHPVTYKWAGEIKPVSEPGPFYYVAYYIGTVEGDARILKENKVQRLMVPMSEWQANKKWLIAKLTLFYQVTRGLQ